MEILELIVNPARGSLHTFSVRQEGGECHFRAHYSARNRNGGRVRRFLELRCDEHGGAHAWKYRSGYAYHDTQFWSVPEEALPHCGQFARFVAERAHAELMKELSALGSACARAGFLIATSY